MIFQEDQKQHQPQELKDKMYWASLQHISTHMAAACNSKSCDDKKCKPNVVLWNTQLFESESVVYTIYSIFRHYHVFVRANKCLSV